MENTRPGGKRRAERDVEAVREAYGIRPVLPESTGGKANSGNAGQIAPGSELNPHLRAVLERLKERDRERER